MELGSEEKKVLLPHHEQQALCTTRLPYRQGRKLTAVKVYTVNNESKHLLVFGVPSLSLRQELKALLSKFGRLQHVTVSPKHQAEVFTETYHAAFERIASARLAKRMLDTKGFYGGVLHVCYAPEYETVDDTRLKLELRKRDIFLRLKNLARDKSQAEVTDSQVEVEPDPAINTRTINMGEVNTIQYRETESQNEPTVQKHKDWRDTININSRTYKRKSTYERNVVKKQFKPCFVSNEATNSSQETPELPDKDIVDLTSVNNETVTNINVDKTLNYSTFGKELIKKLPPKTVNVIKFHNTSSKK